MSLRSNVRVEWRGDLISKEAQAAAKQAISDAAEFILQESNKIVPLDEGTLLRSGNTDIEVNKDGVRASVYYDTPYAIRMHEHPEYKFQHSRQGKFLEKTIYSRQAKILQYLADAYQKFIGRKR